jgi:hypothetical protein
MNPVISCALNEVTVIWQLPKELYQGIIDATVGLVLMTDINRLLQVLEIG